MGINQLKETRGVYDLDGLNRGDVVIVPAFGTEVHAQTASRKSAATRSTPPAAT
jgi:hypothetical protein